MQRTKQTVDQSAISRRLPYRRNRFSALVIENSTELQLQNVDANGCVSTPPPPCLARATERSTMSRLRGITRKVCL